MTISTMCKHNLLVQVLCEAEHIEVNSSYRGKVDILQK